LAFAQSTGVYGAIDFGKSTFNNFCNDVVGGATGVSCVETDTTIRLAVGNQLNEYFGIEGSYGPTVEASAGDLSTTFIYKNTEFQFAAIVSLPISNNFSLLGKAGISLWNVEASLRSFGPPLSESASGNSLLWGVGAKYDINETMAIRGQYESHNIGNTNTGDGKLNTLSMGIVIKF